MKPVIAALVLVASASTATAQLAPAHVARLRGAALDAESMRALIPQDYWEKARCVIVIPDQEKAAATPTRGEYGKGVMSCRASDGWSAPVFMQLAHGTWGFQAGAEPVDLVLLVMNADGVQK